MAYSVYSYGSQYLDAGQIGIYVGTREENLRECLEVIGAELRDVGEGKLRNGELERAKENMKGRLLLSLESTSARMSRLGKAVVLGTEILPIEEIVRRIVAVTEDDVAALARDLYAPELLSAAGIGPSEKRFGAAVRRLNPDAVERAA
jgi:predicted Zn-dependent peptidase